MARRNGFHPGGGKALGVVVRVQDAELCKAIEESEFHKGMETARQMQEHYSRAIKARLLPRTIELVHIMAAAVATGKYRQTITKAKRLIALMERVSED